jgi:hypothetical protein
VGSACAPATEGTTLNVAINAKILAARFID